MHPQIKPPHVRKIYFRQGSGETLNRNLKDLLEELWRVAVDAVVEDFQLQECKIKYRKHFDLLQQHKCIQLVFSFGNRGEPGISKIRLLKRNFEPALFEGVRGAPYKHNKPKARILPTVAKEQHSSPSGPPQQNSGLEKKEGLITKETRDMRNAILVFVDAANFGGRRQKQQYGVDDISRKTLPLTRVNWKELYGIVSRGYMHIENSFVHSARVYLYDKMYLHGEQLFVEGNIRSGGFQLVRHDKGNIDPLLAGDMGLLVRDAMDTFSELTLVLVSGDGDYGHVVRQLKEVARKKSVKLRVWIIAWSGSMSGELIMLSDHKTFLGSLFDSLTMSSSPQEEKYPVRETVVV